MPGPIAVRVKRALVGEVRGLFNDRARGETPVVPRSGGLFEPGAVARRVHGDVQGFDGEIIGKACEGERLHGLRHRRDLERHLGHHRQSCPASGQAAGDIEPRHVLHDPAAGFEKLGSAIDGAHTEEIIACASRQDATRARKIGGENAADRKSTTGGTG